MAPGSSAREQRRAASPASSFGSRAARPRSSPTSAPTVRPRQPSGNAERRHAGSAPSVPADRRSAERSAVAQTVAGAHHPGRRRPVPPARAAGVRPLAARTRTRPASSTASTTQSATGSQSATRATIASATRSGSRLALTDANHLGRGRPPAPGGASAPAEAAGACSARSVRISGTLFRRDGRPARDCRPVPVNRLCVPCGMADPSKCF